MVPLGLSTEARARAALAALRVLALLSLGVLQGCSAVDYYWQGIEGQYRIIADARPLDQVIAASDDARLRERLALAQRARDFATAELGLPANGSYRRYTDLGRAFVTWNVFAAPALSLEPRAWCYPVAGCVNYRGYFDEARARAEADALRTAGDDVYVGGVPAYSTLGWFDDPILSSYVRYPETEFVRLIFHELAHQLLYVKGDTVFNESFATAVSDEGLDRWIAAQAPDVQARLNAERARNERLRAAFATLALRAREALAATYAAPMADDAKLARKAEVFATMREDYERAKAGEPGLAGFDRWFRGYADLGPNNASLAAFALYTRRVPAFRQLIMDAHGDLGAFYARVRELASMEQGARDRALDTVGR